MATLVWIQWLRSTEYTRFVIDMPPSSILQLNIRQNYLQVDLKVDDLKSKLDRNGNIRKNEFIEFSIESKLLDVTERKTSAVDTPKVGSRNNCCSINKLVLASLGTLKTEKKTKSIWLALFSPNPHYCHKY